MLEQITITALLSAAVVHLAKKWGLYQRLGFVPCEFCFAFWLTVPCMGVIFAADGVAFTLTNFFLLVIYGLCAATLAHYILIRTNMETD